MSVIASSLHGYLKSLRASKLLPDELLVQTVEAFLAMPTSAQADKADPDVLGRYLIGRRLLTGWQHRMLLAERCRGFHIGGYRLLEQLGRGDTSMVYLAEHVRMRRRVALKVLPREMTQQQQALERFLREARAIASLDHPNIVHAYDVGHSGDLYYLVMQYVPGQDLEQMVLNQGPLAPERAGEYIRQAACGLEHAHARGMIHRDVKPSNLIVERDNTVRLLDLGLALSAGEQRMTLEQDEPLTATADFLSPEQAVNSQSIDHRADLYSLGCTLYFLLTGEPPFAEGTLSERLLKHQRSEPPSLLEKRPELPTPPVEICRRMMAKLPADRYSTAQEVVDALSAWLPPRAPGPPPDAYDDESEPSDSAPRSRRAEKALPAPRKISGRSDSALVDDTATLGEAPTRIHKQVSVPAPTSAELMASTTRITAAPLITAPIDEAATTRVPVRDALQVEIALEEDEEELAAYEQAQAALCPSTLNFPPVHPESAQIQAPSNGDSKPSGGTRLPPGTALALPAASSQSIPQVSSSQSIPQVSSSQSIRQVSSSQAIRQVVPGTMASHPEEGRPASSTKPASGVWWRGRLMKADVEETEAAEETARAAEASDPSGASPPTEFLEDPSLPEIELGLTRRKKWMRTLVAALSIGLLGLMLSSNGMLSGEASTQESIVRLRIDWNEAERPNGAITIDGKVHPVSPQGALELTLEPGAHLVALTRPGYQPEQHSVTAASGHPLRIAPVWKPLPETVCAAEFAELSRELKEFLSRPFEPSSASQLREKLHQFSSRWPDSVERLQADALQVRLDPPSASKTAGP